MRQHVRKFVAMAKRLPLQEAIFEFGSRQVPGQESMDLRDLFPGMEYVGCDIQSGNGVDLLLDLHNIELPAESAGTVLCLDTLEHVEFCHQAVKEMHRVLKPGGFCIISSVFSFPIHDFPEDFWRFTPRGLESLLQCFESQCVFQARGPKDRPQTVFGVGAKANIDLKGVFRADS